MFQDGVANCSTVPGVPDDVNRPDGVLRGLKSFVRGVDRSRRRPRVGQRRRKLSGRSFLTRRVGSPPAKQRREEELPLLISSLDRRKQTTSPERQKIHSLRKRLKYLSCQIRRRVESVLRKRRRLPPAPVNSNPPRYYIAHLRSLRDSRTTKLEEPDSH